MSLGGNWKRYLADLGERAIKTFLQAYLAAWVAYGTDYDHLFTERNLKIAVAATVFSVLTSLVSKGVSNPASASVLPSNLQPPAPIPDDPDPTAPDVVPGPEETDESVKLLTPPQPRQEDLARLNAALVQAHRAGVQDGASAAVTALARNAPALAQALMDGKPLAETPHPETGEPLQPPNGMSAGHRQPPPPPPAPKQPPPSVPPGYVAIPLSPNLRLGPPKSGS